MKTVNFTEMKNGNKDDYQLLEKYEKNFERQTADRILGYLSKMNTSKEDIALCVKDKIFETGTSNLLFVKKNKI